MRQVTTKDLFVAYLLNEISGNQSESAYRKALEDFRTAFWKWSISDYVCKSSWYGKYWLMDIKAS